MRKIIPFHDHWQFCKPGENPIEVTLPHTWNNVDGQDGGNDYWRGTAVYTKQFPMPELSSGERAVLEFTGAAMTADVTLNGIPLAHHEGGYSTFRMDMTDSLKADNFLVVRVDNSENQRVYPQSADFTFYGGLYRNVNLILVPSEHFELLKDGAPGMKVTPEVNLKSHSAAVLVETWQDSAEVTITVNGETQIVPSVDGYAWAEFLIPNVRLWDGLNDPYLYTAEARLSSGDEIRLRFGCRTMEIDPEKGFFLNGKPYPLRGVSRHQDRIGIGNALLPEHHQQDMALIRELGANTVRLAHYQHDQEFYDLCDEAGILVWAEIPYISQHMPEGRDNTISQMRELVAQNHHHPSILCWGLSNELSATSVVDEDMLENHRILNQLCHDMDSTRFTTMAHISVLEHESPLTGIADLGSYNLYFGWYSGKLEDNGAFLDAYHAKYPNRPIGLSEYGADTNIRFHSASPKRGDYTEEYQCLYHEKLLQMITERPYLWATHVWNLFDFAADGRDEGEKKGQNQKGLVEFDHKTRKDAFYLYKAAWSKEPFVHICGRRFADRTEETVQIKVYSNCKTVTLLVDGIPVETKKGFGIFQFTVTLHKEHTIRAVSGPCSDEICLRKVEKPNESYHYKEAGDVADWFGREAFRENCYSINDTIGDLLLNPKAKAVFLGIFTQPGQSDSAQSPFNDATLRMMAVLSLKNILKRAGENVVSPEQIKQINAVLQEIPKESKD